MYIILCCSEVVYWKEFLGLWTALLDPFPTQKSLSPEKRGFRFLPKNEIFIRSYNLQNFTMKYRLTNLKIFTTYLRLTTIYTTSSTVTIMLFSPLSTILPTTASSSIKPRPSSKKSYAFSSMFITGKIIFTLLLLF